MKLYFITKKQFIGEIEIDETKTPIIIPSELYMDHEYYDLQSKNPSIHATFIFKNWISIEKELECKYYDVNLNIIDKKIIDSIKYDRATHDDFETDGQKNLYKTQEHVHDIISYHIYFGKFNEKEIYVKPEKNTGIITLYDEYGNIKETFFHINGKINGKKITYYGKKTVTDYVNGMEHGESITYNRYNKIIHKCYYVNGTKHGETIKYNNDDDIIEKGYYLNGKLDGDYIFYYNNVVDIIIQYKLGKVYKVTKFFDNEKIKVDNSYNKDGILESHKSFYYDDVKFLEIMYNDENDSYKLTHYFENGNIAWKATHKMAYHDYVNGSDASREDVQEIYNEDGMPITLDEFDKLYDKKQLKTDNIYDMYVYGRHNVDVLWSSFFNPYKFIEFVKY